MKIKCIIIDDEPLARKGLKGYIEKIDFLSLVAECEDAIQLNSTLKTLQPDLLFLDIEMPEITGIELLSNMVNPPKVIIVWLFKIRSSVKDIHIFSPLYPYNISYQRIMTYL